MTMLTTSCFCSLTILMLNENSATDTRRLLTNTDLMTTAASKFQLMNGCTNLALEGWTRLITTVVVASDERNRWTVVPQTDRW